RQDGPTAGGQILVSFRPTATASTVDAAHQAANGTRLATIPQINVQVVRVPPGGDVDAALATYRSLPSVAYAEPNREVHALITPNDQLFGQQWGLTKILAPTAWNSTTGSSSVTIGVLDTGIDTGHPEFQGRILAGWNTLTNTGNVTDGFGHGTHVAGIA